MAARDLVVAALEAAMPAGVTVIPFARKIDPPSQSTVMVRIDEVTPSVLPQCIRDYQFALILIAAQTTAGPADNELDALLEDVLTAIDRATDLSWSRATRATYEESNPAYQVDLTAINIKEN